MKLITHFSMSLIVAVLSATSFAAPGDLLKMEQGAVIDQATLLAQRNEILPGAPGKVITGVILYKITYETQDLQHQVTSATGLMIVPDVAAGTYSLLSYQHGTLFDRASAPSSGQGIEAAGMALMYGGIGYVVSMADYLGLGDSTSFHPYLHADSEAWTAADMLRAVRQAVQKLGVKLDSKLFLTGYSQGGHSTMALHIHLERDLASEFTVTASAPMAGPYDLSDTTWKQVLLNPSLHATAEAAYLLKAMQMIYGLNTLMQDAIQPQYLAQTNALLDGMHNMDAVVAGLPKTPTDYLNSDFIKAALSDPNSPLVKALAKNNVYEWKPVAPVHLYQGKADTEVPYQNSEVAYARMKALGAQVELTNVGDKLDHSAAAIPSLMQSAAWFEQFRKAN
jgi:predicted esterase